MTDIGVSCQQDGYVNGIGSALKCGDNEVRACRLGQLVRVCCCTPMRQLHPGLTHAHAHILTHWTRMHTPYDSLAALRLPRTGNPPYMCYEKCCATAVSLSTHIC